MPLGDDQRVHWGNGKSVTDRVAKLILGDDPFFADCAKYASLISDAVGCQHVSKIGIVPVSLVRVACDAERLKVAQVVASAFGARHDMIDMQGSLFFMGPAKLTTVLGALEHLIPDRARNIAIRNAAVPPNAITSLTDIGGQTLLAEINE